MDGTIFDTASIDRKFSRWEDKKHDLTPVQRHGDMHFKRDDYFAPLGPGGINGAKLRQLIHIVQQYQERGGKGGLLTGASVISPQLAMGAAVAKHFGMKAELVIGATNPSSSIRRPMVELAAWFGAEFRFIPVAYNPALQRECVRLYDAQRAGWFYLEYGITKCPSRNPAEDVYSFHKLGAEQTANIPDDIEDLVIPAGSCNSCTSILHGLVRHQPRSLKRIHLIGIGPTKIKMVNERLRLLEHESGLDHKIFNPCFEDPTALEGMKMLRPLGVARYDLHYTDLHGTGRVAYHERLSEQYQGIQFHPNYEAKVWWHLRTRAAKLIRPTTLFWIIGSEPSRRAMETYLHKRFGQPPTQAPQVAI